MKIQYLFPITWLCLSILTLAAQEQAPPPKLTLEEAIQIAIRNNATLKKLAFDEESARQRVEEARFRQLPVVSGTVDFQRNLIIPSTPVPANAFNPNAPADEINALRFGANWTANAGLNASYSLLDKRIGADIREREAEAKLTAVDRELSEAELKTQVRLAYAEYLLAHEQAALAREDTLNSWINLQVIDDQYRNGRTRVTDLNQARIERNNARSRLAESRLTLDRARNKLLYYLGYPDADQEITPAEDLEALYDKFQPTEIPTLDFDRTPAGRQLRQQLQLTDLRLTNTRTDDLPTVSLRGFLGAGFFDNNFRLFNAGNWFGNSFVALTLDVPITSRIENRRRIAQWEFQLQSARAALQSGAGQSSYEFRQALEEVNFYRSELKIKEENRRLAEENYQAALQTYREGRSTAEVLSAADFQFKQSKSFYLQAFYEYVQAAIELARVRGV